MSLQLEINSELGKRSEYATQYDATLLFPIPRAEKRLEIGINPQKLPFYGFDVWNHYEVSWLNDKGKPVVAIAEIVYDCNSTSIIESKSLKLYFNSFNNTSFASIEEVESTIKRDIKKAIGSEVFVKIQTLSSQNPINLESHFLGESIDELDVSCSVYTVNPEFLSTSSNEVEEVLHSDLLKSNCLVTLQPDWGSVQIHYRGPKIDREGLLKYIVSFRNHNEFHEQCIERIFIDILTYCKPSELTVYGRYTRRGGLDINPYRSTKAVNWDSKNIRLSRQ